MPSIHTTRADSFRVLGTSQLFLNLSVIDGSLVGC